MFVDIINVIKQPSSFLSNFFWDAKTSNTPKNILGFFPPSSYQNVETLSILEWIKY